MNAVARLVEARIRYWRMSASVYAASGDGGSLADALEQASEKHELKTALWFEGIEIDYAVLESRANRFAHWALSEGLRCGARLAIYMDNDPDYVAICIGMAKIGVCTVFIDHGLTGADLQTALDMSDAEAVITKAHFVRLFAGRGLPIWTTDADIASGFLLEPLLSGQAQTRPHGDYRRDTSGEDALFASIFDNGQGVEMHSISHDWVRLCSHVLALTGLVNCGDLVLLSLSLHDVDHGMVVVVCALLCGAGIALLPRFSPEAFWRAARLSGADKFTCSGRMLNFLLAEPPGINEREHRLVAGFGVGIRKEAGRSMLRRSSIGRLTEFASCAEAGMFVIGLSGDPGVAGWMILCGAPMRRQCRLLRCDGRGALLTDAAGRHVEAGRGEPGEAVIRIDSAVGHDEDLLIRNVFAPGDVWIRSRILLIREGRRRFRWFDRHADVISPAPGQLVSTSDLADVLAGFSDVAHACVYGVELPGSNVRGVMAAVSVCGDSVNLSALSAYLSGELSPASQPVFLRIVSEPPVTTALAWRRADLERDGFAPDKIADPLYFNDREAGVFRPVDAALCRHICAGGVVI